MRGAIVMLLAAACSSAPAIVETRDAAIVETSTPIFADAQPGPIDDDASVPVGGACVPGKLDSAPIASLVEGPFVDDGSIYWLGHGDESQPYWWAHEDAVGWSSKGKFAPLAIAHIDATASAGFNFAIGADSIYWVTSVGEASDSRVLVRAAKDGSSQTQLGVPATLSNLAVRGDRLYFVNGSKLVSAALDGTDMRTIVDTERSVFIQYVIGDAFAYFTAGGSPKRVALAGGAAEDLAIPRLIDVTAVALGSDGFVYAITGYPVGGSRIVSIPDDDGTAAPIGKILDARKLAVDGAWIYFSTSAGVFRMRTDGSASTQIGEGPVMSNIAIDSTTVRWSNGSAMFTWCKSLAP